MKPAIVIASLAVAACGPDLKEACRNYCAAQRFCLETSTVTPETCEQPCLEAMEATNSTCQDTFADYADCWYESLSCEATGCAQYAAALDCYDEPNTCGRSGGQTVCAPGDVALCTGPCVNWTGEQCCVAHAEACAPGTSSGCSDPDEYWTGQHCCILSQ